MYPQNNDTQDSQPAKDWFSSVNQPPAESEPTPEPPHHKRIVVIGILMALILLILGTVAFTYMTPSTLRTTAQCLTASQYQAFTGTAITDKQYSPKDNFYSTIISYAGGDTSPVKPTQAEIDSLMKKIGAFYEQHSLSTSIVVTLSGNYPETSSADVATSRLLALKQSLVSRGVSEQSIVVEKPVQLVYDGELAADSPELLLGKGYLTITSAASCSQ